MMSIENQNDVETTPEVMEAKGLENDGQNPVSDGQKLGNRQAMERRQEILKQGSIPEFVHIRDSR